MSRRRWPRATKLSSSSILNSRLGRCKPSDTLRFFKIRGHYLLQDLNDTIVVSAGQRNLVIIFVRASMVSDRGTYSAGQTKTLITIGQAFDPGTSGPSIGSGLSAGAINCVISSGTVVPGWYFLQDLNKKEDGASPPPRHIGGELIRVVSVAGSIDTFATTVSQNYASNASNGDLVLSATGAAVCENISLRGGKFYGRRYSKDNPGEGTYLACVYAGYVAGFSIQRTCGSKSTSSIFAAKYCRDIQYDHCTGSELAKPSAAGVTGEGYTFQVDRSVNILAKNCWATDTRYGFVVEGGSAKVSVIGFRGDSCADGVFDIHGGDAYNVSADRIEGSGPKVKVQIGNTTYRRGCDAIFLTNCNVKQLETQGAVRNLTFDGGTMERAKFAPTTTDPNVGASPGYPSVVTIKNCTVSNPASESLPTIDLTNANSASSFRFVTIRFDNCSIYQLNTGQNLLKSSPVRALSDLVFVGCYLQIDGANDMMRAENDGTEAGGVTIQWVGCNAQLPVANKVATCVLSPGVTSTLSKFLNSTNGGTTPNKRRASGGSYANLTSADVSVLGWVPS